MPFWQDLVQSLKILDCHIRVCLKLWHDFCIFIYFAFRKGREEDMTKEQMLKKISELESINDQLQTEIRYLDKLLREVGFEEGLKTLKFAAKELIEQDRRIDHEEESSG
jgi:hypothetical protein